MGSYVSHLDLLHAFLEGWLWCVDLSQQLRAHLVARLLTTPVQQDGGKNQKSQSEKNSGVEMEFNK